MLDIEKTNELLNIIYNSTPPIELTEESFRQISKECKEHGCLSFLTDREEAEFLAVAEKMEKKLIRKWFFFKKKISIPTFKLIEDITKITEQMTKVPFRPRTINGVAFKYAFSYMSELREVLIPKNDDIETLREVFLARYKKSMD